MPGASFSDKYLKEKDQNGVLVGNWAEQGEPGYFICKCCLPQKPLCFKKGKRELTRHSESVKHIQSFKAWKNASGSSLTDLLKKPEEEEILQKASFKKIICQGFSPF